MLTPDEVLDAMSLWVDGYMPGRPEPDVLARQLLDARKALRGIISQADEFMRAAGEVFVVVDLTDVDQYAEAKACLPEYQEKPSE